VSDVDRRVPILVRKINVTASFNELLRDGLMPIFGRAVERAAPILRLNINVTASFNQLLRHGSMPSMDHTCSEDRRYSELQGVVQGRTIALDGLRSGAA